MTQFSKLRALAVAVALGTLSLPAAGQGNCTTNGNAVCAVGGTATYGITLTITKASRVIMSTTALTMTPPTAATYDAGFSTPTSLGIIVQSNTSWVLDIQSLAATWTASPGGWVAKPVGDLQWSFVIGGPYTDFTTAYATIQSGTASAGANFTMYVRSKLSWANDAPATYSLPLQVRLTAP